ncbi:MAG: MFS transporter [Thermoguttaceae bacterium]|jgi:MFS family permease
MAESKSSSCMYLRLQIAYALEFAIWGGWSYVLGSFCGLYQVNSGLLYGAFAFGALFSPLVGPIADKKFAAQKVLAFMQLICGAALLACGMITKNIMANGAFATLVNPSYLWIAMMFVAGLMFMPSIPLLNAIVFKHIPDQKRSPFVFIFGTIGWIVVNLVLTHVFKGGHSAFYFLSAGIAIALAIYALTLPDTPPAKSSSDDPFGFKALKLFARPDFALFITCATLVGIFGSNYYFQFVDRCFPDKGVYNQYSELIFMAALAFAVAKIGLKWTLTFGMAAWGVRYLFFAQGGESLALIGLLLHGLAYAFLYTAAYMYGDRVAPKELKASVQALIAFLLLGVAQVLSGFAGDVLVKQNKIETAERPAVTYVLQAPAYAQDDSIDAALNDVAEATLDDDAIDADVPEAILDDIEIDADVPEDAVTDETAFDDVEIDLDIPEDTAADETALDDVDATDEVEIDADTTEDSATDETALDDVDATDEVEIDADTTEDSATDETALDDVDATDEVEIDADTTEDSATDETALDDVDATDEVEIDADTAEDSATEETALDDVDATDEVEIDADTTEDSATDETATDDVDASEDTATGETDSDVVAPSSKGGYSIWDDEVKSQYNWRKIWGIPGVFCMIFAIIFAIFGREPTPFEEEEEATASDEDGEKKVAEEEEEKKD